LARFYPNLGAVKPAVLVAFWNRHNKFKKNQKNTNPSRCVMLCDLVVMKNNKLWILQLFWKRIQKIELSRTKFYDFKAKWASYSHNHGMVCSTDPILCICVYLGMKNNVDFGCFLFLGIKKFTFYFSSAKIGFFVKHLAKICLKNGPI
jgi:hypothetical protein